MSRNKIWQGFLYWLCYFIFFYIQLNRKMRRKIKSSFFSRLSDKRLSQWQRFLALLFSFNYDFRLINGRSGRRKRTCGKPKLLLSSNHTLILLFILSYKSSFSFVMVIVYEKWFCTSRNVIFHRIVGFASFKMTNITGLSG